MPELAGKPNFLEIMLGFAELFSCGIRREPQTTLKKPKYCSFVLETLNFLESKSGFQDTWQLLDQNNRIARGLRAAQGMGSCQERCGRCLYSVQQVHGDFLLIAELVILL